MAAGTAYDSVRGLAMTAGETLLILGVGGGVGVAAAQLAVSEGVTVVATASRAKRDFVASLGATPVPYHGDDTADRLAATLPKGANAVLGLVGGDALDTVSALMPPAAVSSPPPTRTPRPASAPGRCPAPTGHRPSANSPAGSRTAASIPMSGRSSPSPRPRPPSGRSKPATPGERWCWNCGPAPGLCRVGYGCAT